MDIKVIFWIAVTIVIFLIIIAFWSERDMFFKRKEKGKSKQERESKLKVSRKKKALIDAIDLTIEFLQEFDNKEPFIESGDISIRACWMLHNFVLKLFKEQGIDLQSLDRESDIYKDLYDLKYAFDLGWSWHSKPKEDVLRKLKRIRINLLNDNQFLK